jgi:uncharacterized membrane protein
MSAYTDAKRLFDGYLGSLGALAETWNETSLARACWTEVERLRDGRLEIVVCGEFKVGKSMLINALLGQADLVPVDFDIATSTIIMIRNGDEPKAFVVTADGGEPFEIRLSDISRWASEKDRSAVEEPAAMILVEVPSPFLSDSLILVDTPGISGLSRTHSEITFTELAKADLVLFVAEAQRPLTRHELAFIEDRILPLNMSIAIILSKSDLQPDVGEVEAANLEKLVPLFAEPPPLFAVASRLKLRHLVTTDPEDLRESGHETVETYISELMESTGQQRIVARAASAVDDAATKLLDPRRTELIALQGEGSPEFVALKAKIDTARDQARRLQRNHGEWRNRLAFEISEIRTKVIDRGLNRELVELETGFHAKANESSAVGDELHKVARDLEQDIQIIFVKCCQSLADATDTLRQKLAAETGVPLTPIVRDAASTVRPPPALRTDKTVGWTTKVGDWANQWRRQVFGGLTVGAFTGGVIGGIIGFFAGGVGAIPGFLAGMNIGAGIGMSGGAVTGIPAANKFVRERKMSRAREALESQLGPYLRLVTKEITDNCYELLARIKESLTHEFDLRIADAETDLKAREAALARGLELEMTAIAARAAILRDEIGKVEAIRSSAALEFARFQHDEA